MTDQTYDKAISIKREIGWIEHAEFKDYPESVDSNKAARLVVEGLYTFYKKDIDEFCTSLIKRYYSDREKRLKELRDEFDAL